MPDSVDVTDDQHDRARQLASKTDFSIDEAKRIILFADTPPADRSRAMLTPANETRSDAGVGPDTCAKIRRAMLSASDARDVVPSFPDLTASQVFAHAKGRCDHDIDEPTTLSPRISPVECIEMRDAFVRGKSIKEIKTDFYRSTNAVLSHVFGACNHDHGPRGTHLSPTEIDRLRDVYESGASRTMAEVAAAFRVSPSTVHYHVCDERRDESH